MVWVHLGRCNTNVEGNALRDPQSNEGSSMASFSPYLHVLDGRVRIKLPQVKGAPQRALAVEQLLRRLDGVTRVTANPITGNVLVLFTSAILGQHDILAALQQTGYLREDHAAEQSPPNLLSLIMHSALDKALERLVLALI
jgi:copper chaperone CopZ